MSSTERFPTAGSEDTSLSLSVAMPVAGRSRPVRETHPTRNESLSFRVYWIIKAYHSHLVLPLFILIHAIVFAHGFFYYSWDDFITTRSTLGLSFPIASATGMVLHFDLAIVMLPLCRTLVSLLRRTPLNATTSYSSKITFHELTAWSMLCLAWAHAIAHWINFACLAAQNGERVRVFFLLCFTTGPGWSGHVMLLTLTLIAAISYKRAVRIDRAGFFRFWFSHKMFLIFLILWSVHGTFCLFRADRMLFRAGLGTFWPYWAFGAMLYLLERVLRVWRGRHKIHITKVIQHSHNVIEIQMEKGKIKARIGQVGRGYDVQCPMLMGLPVHLSLLR